MRASILAHGEFFGTVVAEQRVGGFVVSLTDYDRGASIPWHRHAEPCLTFVIGGAYRERLAGSARECTAHSLVLHEPGELHADDFAARSRCLGIYFDPQRIGMTVDRGRILQSPAVAQIAGRAARELGRRDSTASLVIEGLMLQLFGEISRNREGKSIPPWLRRVREEIRARYREPLTMRDLAASVGVHPVHLARAFRTHFGCTPGDMIRHARVEHAKAAIRRGRALGDVAVDAGFVDQSHLTRTFRALTDVTPGAFRRAHRVPKS